MILIAFIASWVILSIIVTGAIMEVWQVGSGAGVAMVFLMFFWPVIFLGWLGVTIGKKIETMRA